MGRAVLAKDGGSAIQAAPPKDGEVFRTALPDTFDGIRFEIGRMVTYVQDGRKDPLMIETARQLCSAYGDFVAEMGRREGQEINVHNNKTLYVEAIDLWCREHFTYVNDPPNIEVIQTGRRMVKQTRVPREVIASIMDPFFKAMEQADPSFNRSSYTPPAKFVGDCVPFSQKIVVRERASHSYSIKEIGDLERSYKYYHVVSYNEKTQKTEFKPIERFIDKGELPVYKVSLSNGTSFRATENHLVYVFRHHRLAYSSRDELETMTLGDLIKVRAGSRSSQYTIPIAVQIPEADLKSRYTPKLSQEQLWVEGLYVAEGWAEASGKGIHRGTKASHRAKIGMNNTAVIDELKKNLTAIGRPFGEHKRKDGLITVRINASEFAHRLGIRFGKNSAEKRFPRWYPSLSKEQLTTLLHSYALGDGFIPTRGQWKDWVHVVYNTKSGVLAKQIQFMHMVLGRPVSLYHQPAWKNKSSMYRVYEYKGSAKQKLPDLGSVKIKSIEHDGVERCCDITVADNHNFVLEGGALVHNCDEAAVIFCTLCACMDIGPVQFRFGGNDGTLHHVWGRVQADGKWYDSDLTEPGYRLGDFSNFSAYESVEIPL